MEPVLISAFEHWSYCQRQCGLIHLEHIWDENVFTLRGKAHHERVDQPISRGERGRRIERGLPIWSDTYGLIGKADVVEFMQDGTPVPVEYKSGRARNNPHAALQLCAQALCLEEMFRIPVVEGAIFFVGSKIRQTVNIDAELRRKTLGAANEIRALMETGVLPPPANDRRCRHCSLIEACMPYELTMGKQVQHDLYKPMPERELP